MALQPVTIETDFSSFMKTDVNSSMLKDTFVAALEGRSEDKKGSRRLVQSLLERLQNGD